MSLEHLVPLKEYVPAIYKDCKEMDELVRVEDNIFQTLRSVGVKEYARFYIQTSDEEGVRRFENILKITPNPAIETLQFRKERLLTRCNSTLPYTTIWLRNYLNSILGKDNYELDVDYKDLIIRLYGQILDYSWSKEANDIINEVKPCNVIFINIPTVINNLTFQNWWDEGTWGSDIWNDDNVWTEYRILTRDEMPDYEKETDDVNLNTLKDEIISAKLNNNDTLIITNIQKDIRDNTLYINFYVPQGVTTVTNIKLINSLGNAIISSDSLIAANTGTQINIRFTSWKKKENI